MHTKLRTAEELLAAKRYADAADLLDSIQAASLEQIEEGKWHTLRSEAHLYLGRLDSIDIDRAIECLRRTAETDWFARAKFLKGWYLAARGQHRDASEELLEAYASYLRCENLSSAARTLNRLSYSIMQVGNLATAAENIERCRAMYHQANEVSRAIEVTYNLAYVRILQGRLQDSIALYNVNSESLPERPAKFAAIIHFMSALPHALLGDIATARTTIAKAVPYLDQYVREKAIYFENLGLIEILDRQYAAAEKALRAGLDISLEIAPESALVSQIKRLFGDLYVATERWDLAEQYTTEGLAVAEKINERIEIAACWRLFAQIELHRDHADKAREWFEKAIDLFSLIGARYELAVTRYLAATSGLYVNGERTAILYLAREYFESENVAHYLDKVDRALRAEPVRPRRRQSETAALPALIYRAEPTRRIVDLAEHVAQSTMNILLNGETGTGKDVLARFIHYHSGREGEFVPVNTAAIPNDMIEAELFGHAKGAFTGAATDRAGLIEQADNGTLYLNEIADASPEFQAKLLEVLETRQVRRLGQNKLRPVSFRLISATNHDLNASMRENRFRLDLYHRLAEILITLPPLRDRLADIGPLVEHFLNAAEPPIKINGNAAEVERLVRALSRRTWPGNVRELKAEVRRLCLEHRGDLAAMADDAETYEPDPAETEAALDVERDQLLRLLEETGWNRRETARRLNLSEATVRRRMQKLGIDCPQAN